MRAFFGHAAHVLVLTLATSGLVCGQPTTRGSQPPTRTPPAAAKRAPAPPAAPRKEVSVPFRVGETLTYDVSWSQYMVAGSAVSRVVEKRGAPTSSAYYIVAEGKPLPLIARIYALYYKMDSLLDSFTALSQRTSLYTEEGSKKRSVSTTFNRSTKRALFEMQADPPAKSEFVIPADVQDGLATLYALRSRSLEPGARLTIPVADEGLLYSVIFDVGAPETVKVPFGSVNAWNLGVTILDGAGQPAARNVRAWISTDARRLPIKLQADLPVGSFILALRTAQ